MTEILLVNFLFLLFPVSMYLIFFENRAVPRQGKILLIIFSAVSLILCMSFPIQMEQGFIYDLRYIPFVLASLFGGYLVAFPLYVILNVYRFMIGGEFAVDSFIFSTIIFIAVPALKNYFLRKSSRSRIIIASLVSLLVMLFYLITLLRFFTLNDPYFWEITANVLLIHVIGTAFIVTLIERIIINIDTREKLLQSERLALVSELSASVAHEIRNPLTVTSGFLQLLKQSGNLPSNEKRYVDLSLLEVQRAESIVTDFLSLAKPQEQNMVTSILQEEAEYVRNIMVPFANLHLVKISLRFSNTHQLYFDQNQMKQCLINICKNGIESMKDDPGTLYMDISERKNKVIIKVTDSGSGMNAEEISRIGKPYYSTKKEGTGLGMLMVYSTIDKLGGTVAIDSTPGKGTRITLTIPVNE
ncbi:ATP-binding protein [Alkalicoccus daliensis]|uniref:histidine kinase n=1 Tax=Alkalicoccus daliensis TaxID=745820 RepID=A0A1H0ECE8_9BACI|nr:ATP-binding protein [Alkalicoccus daliensis]SDN80157.1 two-component system, sporulation sensor kinase B [Alkalicoccus daliensis]